MLLGLVIALAGSGAAVASTEADTLRAELEILKAENARQAERMRVLEERIHALETGAASQRLRLPLRPRPSARRAPPKR